MKTTLDSIRDLKLYQREDGYRFSVDALLLYSFVNVKRAKKIADLGAGSGIVGLLLAGRYPKAGVTLVELQKGLYELALKNISINGFEGQVSAVRADLREPLKGVSGFDLVVTNPPFRKPLTGLLSEGEERAIARHELKIDLPSLLKSASTMLIHRGRFCMIYHPERLAELCAELASAGLEPKRVRFVHGKRKAEARMLLLEAVKGGRSGLKVEPPMFVYDEEGKYTPELMRIFDEEGA